MDTKKIAASLAAVVGLGAAAFSIASVKPATAQVLPPVRVRPHANVAGRERHPEIRAARRNLEQAKNNLQRAAHDFSGHREKALDLVQQAISQCDQALQADKH